MKSTSLTWAVMALLMVAMGACSGGGNEQGSSLDSGGTAEPAMQRMAMVAPDSTDSLVVRMLQWDSVTQANTTPGYVIDCQHAKDLVDYYRRFVDTDGSAPMTKFVDFPIAEMAEMVQEYNSRASHMRVYFGAKPMYSNGKLVNVMTVFFKGVTPHTGGGQQDIPCGTEVGTRPYDIANPCPPPRCNGVSEYYSPQEMEEEPK